MGSKDGSIVSAIKKMFDDLAKTMWKPLKKKQDTDWRSKQESSSDDDAVIMQISAYTATPPPSSWSHDRPCTTDWLTADYYTE